MMRVGISIGTTFSPDGPGGHREGPRAVFGQARAAARAGLDNLTLGDHHSTGPAGYVAERTDLGRILAEWTDRPIGCLFLVPLVASGVDGRADRDAGGHGVGTVHRPGRARGRVAGSSGPWEPT